MSHDTLVPLQRRWYQGSTGRCTCCQMDASDRNFQTAWIQQQTYVGEKITSWELGSRERIAPIRCTGSSFGLPLHLGAWLSTIHWRRLISNVRIRHTMGQVTHAVLLTRGSRHVRVRGHGQQIPHHGILILLLGRRTSVPRRGLTV